MIRLIAVDLDGTLLNSKNKITDSTKKIIKKAVNLGIYVVLATGRPYKSAKDIQIELNLDHPMILHNGAIIKNLIGGIEYMESITKELAVEFVNYCNVKGYICSIIYNDCEEIYMNKPDEFTYNVHVNCNNTIPILGWHPEMSLQKSITKMIVTNNNPKLISGINIELLEIFGDKLNIFRSGDWYIDIAHKRISKGAALQRMANELNIYKENIMAIGDSRNDIGMFQYSGVSVAMGNSEDYVKEKAAYITLSNDNDGVCEAIKNYVCI